MCLGPADKNIENTNHQVSALIAFAKYIAILGKISFHDLHHQPNRKRIMLVAGRSCRDDDATDTQKDCFRIEIDMGIQKLDEVMNRWC